MKVLLFGANGQVGWQLRRSLAVLGEVVALDRKGDAARGFCGDLANPAGVAATVASVRPDVVVNAAAYTAVDRAEDDRETALSINAMGPEALARATRELGIWLVHYSTDYVYDGLGDKPWRETDPTGPLSAYGQTKLAGDEAIVANNPRHLILRTSWVFDSWGQNFSKSILRAAAARDELTVVADQWGAPTRAALIADVTAHALRTITSAAHPEAMAGVYHLAAGGFTTWHAYAQLLVQEAQALGLPVRVAPDRVRPIPASSYPVRAPRPANSRLDTTRLRQAFGLHLPDWQDGVRAVIAELAHHRPAPAA